ncbi:SDR family oxidoreductase [Nocardioides sp. B-3]|uniref:SDR family oxidoreductase n=1 Tax=Nocardioides sp. B-3 TaxID=2895565 RepID=UPI00215257BD|nr:SDR family oxidoreductase [Nocardioides sp. B-3]
MRRAPRPRTRPRASTTRSSASTSRVRSWPCRRPTPSCRAREHGGAIVNISSISALRPSPGTAVYGAAKAGLDSLTTSLAMEWAPKVRVNAINVGLCRTELTGEHYGDDESVAAIERTIPLGRMARPDEVGSPALFLGSDLASYVSGATVACHGGGEPPIFTHVMKSAG